MKALCDCTCAINFPCLLETTLSGTEQRLYPALFLHLPVLPSLFHRSSLMEPQFSTFSAFTLHHVLLFTLSVESPLCCQHRIQATNNLNCHTSLQAPPALAYWKLLELIVWGGGHFLRSFTPPAAIVIMYPIESANSLIPLNCI
jgi:hypothetical protein